MDEQTLRDLRAQRIKALEDADAVARTAEHEKRGLTDDEHTAVTGGLADADRCKTELEAADRTMRARQAIDEARRMTLPEVARPLPVSDPVPPASLAAVAQVRDHATRAYQPGDALAAVVSARIRFAGYQQPDAINWARTTFGEGSPQCRALQQSSFTAGGALISENFVGVEFIELLKAKARVRAAGARSVTLVNGSFTTPKLTSQVRGIWVGQEGQNATPSEPTFGQLILTEKKYMVLVPFSNDLRRNASLDAIRIVRDDLVRTAANDEDLAFLKGSGLAGEPKGIYNWIPAAGKGNSQGTSLANVRTDIRTAKSSLNSNNVAMDRRAWFMHSRAAEYMGWDLVDGNGNFGFASMQQDENATLGGAPAYRDNNISITLGAGTSTEVYYVEMSECFIGDGLDLEIEILENAVYADAAGTLRSGVSRDESAVRLIRKTDFGLRHTESAFVLETVAWGA